MSRLEGSNTLKNLMKAFAGESQARNRYTYFASVAKKEGYNQIEAIFLETADNEKEHAKLFYKAITNDLDPKVAVPIEITAAYPVAMGDTEANLVAAAAGNRALWAGHGASPRVTACRIASDRDDATPDATPNHTLDTPGPSWTELSQGPLTSHGEGAVLLCPATAGMLTTRFRATDHPRGMRGPRSLVYPQRNTPSAWRPSTQEDTPSSAAAQTSRVHSARGTPASSAAALIRATNLSCSSRSASKR